MDWIIVPYARGINVSGSRSILAFFCYGAGWVTFLPDVGWNITHIRLLPMFENLLNRTAFLMPSKFSSDECHWWWLSCQFLCGVEVGLLETSVRWWYGMVNIGSKKLIEFSSSFSSIRYSWGPRVYKDIYPTYFKSSHIYCTCRFKGTEYIGFTRICWVLEPVKGKFWADSLTHGTLMLISLWWYIAWAE